MELITRNQYMKRYNVGYEKLQRMIAKKEVDYLEEADRIRIDENTVRIELYNEEVARRIKAEENLKSIKEFVKGVI